MGYKKIVNVLISSALKVCNDISTRRLSDVLQMRSADKVSVRSPKPRRLGSIPRVRAEDGEQSKD